MTSKKTYSIHYLYVFFILFKLILTSSPAQQEQPKQKRFITKTYTVPPTFGHRWSAGEEDPFAPNSDLDLTPITAQTVLENAGITFAKGASAKYDPKTSELTVRNTKDQIELVDIYLDVAPYPPPKQVNVICEYIEVDRKVYQNWMFDNRITLDGTRLRGTVQKWVKAGQGTILDTIVASIRSGNHGKVESDREIIYPTEFEMQVVPEIVHLDGDDSTAPVKRENGTAFEVRKLGTSLTVDPVVQSDHISIHLSLSLEMVKLDGYTHWPPKNGKDKNAAGKLPKFYSMKTTTLLTVMHGRYALIGTHRPLKSSSPNLKDPIVLVFVRADIATIPSAADEQ